MKLAAPVRNVLLCFLCLIAFRAAPVQSQPAKMTNPTSMAACGLPASWSEFTSAAATTTFNMTADCTFSNNSIPDYESFMDFRSGEFTINGNGHVISGPTNAYAIYLLNSGTVLNLNNVTIRTSGEPPGQALVVSEGARLNARDVTFEDGNNDSVVWAFDDGQIYFENVQFLNNRKGASTGNGSAINAYGRAGHSNTLVSIRGAIFDGNSGAPVLTANNGTIQLHCPSSSYIFRNNVQSGSTPASNWAVSNGGVVEECLPPKKKKEKVPTPMPTSTPRPQIAATHVALQAATGATFRPTFGLDSGVHFRQLDGAGIGIQSIIDAGFLEAFDVYGYVEQGVEVCFPQVGRVVFLDANTSPRAIVPLESTVVNGQTCVSINSAGSLVLLPN